MIAQQTDPRSGVLAARWWTLVVRGTAAIMFGALALIVPPDGLLTLAILWGSYAFADGIWGAMLATCVAGDRQRWGWLAFEGVVSIATGVLMFFWHPPTAAALLTSVAAWSVLVGFSETIGAVRLRPLSGGERVLAAMSLVAFAAGVIRLVTAGPRFLANPWLMDAYTLVFGALVIALGVGIHRWSRVEGRSTT